MNATRIVSQISIASDPAQINDAAPGGSLNSAGRGQDFAATLSNVGAKSGRRQAAGKAHDSAQSGGSLPTPGNLSPPPANAAMTTASTPNPPAAGTAPPQAAADMTTPANTSVAGQRFGSGRDAAALRAEATKITEAASSAAALGAAASGGAVTDPVAGPATMAADGRSGVAISGTQGQRRWARTPCSIPPVPRQDPRLRPSPERILPRPSACRARLQPAARRQPPMRSQWIKHPRRRAPRKFRRLRAAVFQERAPAAPRERLSNRRDGRIRRQTPQPYLQSAAATTPPRPPCPVTPQGMAVRPCKP